MSNAGLSRSSWQTWQQAWDAAQLTLSSLQSSLDSYTHPSARTVRVGKLDSELLDQELVHLLCEPLRKALNITNTALHNRFDLEMGLIIQLTLYKFSIWNLGASYGARLQGLRYHVTSHSNGQLSPSGLPRRTILSHGTLTILVPYFYNRLRAYALSQAWPDTPSSDKRRLAWQMLTQLEASHSLLSLVNFIVFLWNGRYRSLADRLLKMSLVSSTNRVRRAVSYEFMNRQMVWHAFTEFLLFLLPLIKTRSLKHRITRFMSQFTLPALLPAHTNDISRYPLRKRGRYESLPVNQCAICAENASYTLNIGYSTSALESPAPSLSDEQGISSTSDDEVPAFPVYTPYITSCGHIYCYHCICERMMRVADEGSESGWECLRCAESVRSADRLEADQSPRRSDTDSDYEFSSEIDTTEMSGSVSSYLGSLSE